MRITVRDMNGAVVGRFDLGRREPYCRLPEVFGIRDCKLYRLETRRGILWVFYSFSIWENPRKPGTPIGARAVAIPPERAAAILDAHGYPVPDELTYDPANPGDPIDSTRPGAVINVWNGNVVAFRLDLRRHRPVLKSPRGRFAWYLVDRDGTPVWVELETWDPWKRKARIVDRAWVEERAWEYYQRELPPDEEILAELKEVADGA